jgi:hypothetical protein
LTDFYNTDIFIVNEWLLEESCMFLKMFLVKLSALSLLSFLISSMPVIGEQMNTKQSANSTPQIPKALFTISEDERELRLQVVRYRGQPLPSKLQAQVDKINNTNTQLLLAYLAEYTWSELTLQGKDNAERAYFIARQSDAKTQQKLLPLFEKAYADKQFSGHKLAEFTDTVLIGMKKKQRYGTQLAIVNGEIVFNTIEDSENVDARRHKLGLMPLEDYKKLLIKMYKLAG